MAGVVSEPGATAIAASLAELTAGWTPVAGVETSALEAAREALAGALLLGSSVQDILASPLATLTPAPSPELIAELTALAEKVENSPAGLLAVVRSDLAADSFNPAGGPQWARGAQVVATYGPFEDAGGVLQWVDTVALADSQEFTFADGTSFAAFPVATGSITSTPASELTLGAGSVWFLASLVESNFPAGAFAGFEIESGTLTCTEPVDLMNGVFQMQAGATLTLTATPTGASTGVCPRQSDTWRRRSRRKVLATGWGDHRVYPVERDLRGCVRCARRRIRKAREAAMGRSAARTITGSARSAIADDSVDRAAAIRATGPWRSRARPAESAHGCLRAFHPARRGQRHGSRMVAAGRRHRHLDPTRGGRCRGGPTRARRRRNRRDRGRSQAPPGVAVGARDRAGMADRNRLRARPQVFDGL